MGAGYNGLEMNGAEERCNDFALKQQQRGRKNDMIG